MVDKAGGVDGRRSLVCDEHRFEVWAPNLGPHLFHICFSSIGPYSKMV